MKNIACHIGKERIEQLSHYHITALTVHPEETQVVETQDSGLGELRRISKE